MVPRPINGLPLTLAMLRIVSFFVLLALLFPGQLLAQQEDRKLLFRPQAFEPLLFDPLENLTYGTVSVLNRDQEGFEGDYYLPFAFAIGRGFYRNDFASGWHLEIGMEGANYSQFEWIKNITERNLINSDYKFGYVITLQKMAVTHRLRMYHVSSHLGDDYIFRNGVTSYPEQNNVNYETIDYTFAYRFNDRFRGYAGTAFVVRPRTSRKRFKFQAGGEWKKPLKNDFFQWVAGANLTLLQETDFIPGVKYGFGLAGGRDFPVYLLAEHYFGYRPYGFNEVDRIAWIGLGLYMQP